MKVNISMSEAEATSAAAAYLADRLIDPRTKTVMVAGGNTPLQLYERIAEKRLDLSHLNVFTLDEYVGVPADDPRTCSNLLRRVVGQAWRIPMKQFHTLTTIEDEAPHSIRTHEAKLRSLGGLDVAILGLGENGHLGFNEPGSPPDSVGRLVDLEPSSIEANRRWFSGEHAPTKGVTVGLGTILRAAGLILVAFGAAKARAVRLAMTGPRETVPASWLTDHPHVDVFLDRAAASTMPAD